MSKISIAFVDDHPILLDGISQIFESDGSYDVVGKGKSAADAVTIAASHRPDVLVVDLNMPGNAFEAITAISNQQPDTRIIAFTASAGIDAAIKALESGASGYVLKGSTADELRGAIQAVMRGETFITQGFAVKVITALRNASQKEGPRSIKLSIREDQIVRSLLRGQTNKQIATELKISEKTVKHYMTILMQKLNVRNRLEVVIAAQKLSGVREMAGSAYLN